MKNCNCNEQILVVEGECYPVEEKETCLVKGVKGNAEINYRTGLINITPNNLGFEKTGAPNKGVYFKDNGLPEEMDYELNCDVPANAKFTDTTYSNATQSKAGLMSAADKKKLDEIEFRANEYVLPKATNTVLGGVTIGNNITVNDGKISVTKTNAIAALGGGSGDTYLRKDGTWATPKDTTYSNATQGKSGLMSAQDKKKLDELEPCLWEVDSKNKDSIKPSTINNNLTGINTITADGEIWSGSDQRLKTNIKSINSTSLQLAEHIQFKEYSYKNNPNITKYGVIAQDIQEMGLEELVNPDENGILHVDYISLLCLKIAQLEEEIKKLKRRD